MLRTFRSRFRSDSSASPSTARDPVTVAALAGLWTAALPNWPLWRALVALPETASLRGAVFLVGFGLMIAAVCTALLLPWAWRRTIKPAAAVLFVSAALGAHYMGTYGVVLDSTMMVNVLQTDPAEVRDLLGLHLLASLAGLALLPALLLWRVSVRRRSVVAQAGRNGLGMLVAILTVTALGLLLFADLSATMRNHRSLRYLINPLNSYYALVDIAVRAKQRPAGPPAVIGMNAGIAPRAAGARPPLLLLVVGETARADHFALNGYARPTNPALGQTDVLSFRNVTSCGTNTAASLPCMFSARGKSAFESLQHDEENLLDLVRRAGLAVLWIDNQSGCKGLCDRVANIRAGDPLADGTRPAAALCAADGECLDEALMVGLDARLAALPADARGRGVLLVLHQMGSHGPAYFRRSPADRKPFVPECETSVLQQCDRQALVNAYDNSIAYTDHVLALAQRWLAARSGSYDATLLYVSDHGESLGENQIYLHGLPFALAPREQTWVPMLLWSAAWPQAATGSAPRAERDCLVRRLDQPLTHDHLFHSVLGLLGVTAAEYRPALDVRAPCRSR
jgi:lipid A ethanolaminephosphotransferase